MGRKSRRFAALLSWVTLTSIVSTAVQITARTLPAGSGVGPAAPCPGGGTVATQRDGGACSCPERENTSTVPEKTVQELGQVEGMKRVWMVTKEGIRDNMVLYFRLTPGHKLIINNVGSRRLQFGPEHPPNLYVTALGVYDCIGPLTSLVTMFPKAPPKRKWWSRQTVPHEKWIFSAPPLEETEHMDRSFCLTVTDLDTKKTVELKVRVGLISESNCT